MDLRELYWLAGLIEGEGAIKWNKTPNVSLHMTDRDTIERAATALGTKVKGPYVPDKLKPHLKLTWVTEVYGQRAAGWIMTLYPLLQSRRRQQCRAVIDKWKSAPRGRYATKPDYVGGVRNSWRDQSGRFVKS
jgi:hypothetical protein